MAKIKKELLEGLTNSQIKRFFTSEDWKTAPSPIREYIAEGKDIFEIGNRINRVERLLTNIIVDRFLKGDATEEQLHRESGKYEVLSQIESMFGKSSKHKVAVFVDKEMRNSLSKIQKIK